MVGRLGVMTSADVAEELQTTVEAVTELFVSGHLRGFKIAGEWRSTEFHVKQLIDDLLGQLAEVDGQNEAVQINGKDILSMTELNQGWDIVEGWTGYTWPKETEPEHYETVVKKVVRMGDKNVPLTIAKGKRFVAERDRVRVVVFSGVPGGVMYPVVEFCGADDFERSKVLASVIKVNGRKQLKMTDDVPAKYAAFETDAYNKIVTGRYASSNRCVVVHDGDLGAVAMHAILRCQEKGWA